MNKEQLQVKFQALQLLQSETNDKARSYENQIADLEKQLKDINKPKLTGEQFDELREAIDEAIGNWDFDDQDNYSIDFGIDYDNRINCESFCFDNADDLVNEIYEYVARLFAELPENEISIQEHLNQD